MTLKIKVLHNQTRVRKSRRLWKSPKGDKAQLAVRKDVCLLNDLHRDQEMESPNILWTGKERSANAQLFFLQLISILLKYTIFLGKNITYYS